MAGKPKPPEALTAKQEHFAQCIVEGMSQVDAYRTAYDAFDWQPTSIYPEASRTLALPNVSARVASIRQATNEVSKLSAAQLALEVHAIATDPAMKGSTRVAAYALLARQFSEFNERRTVDVSGDLSVDVRALLALRAELIGGPSPGPQLLGVGTTDGSE